MNKKLLSFLSLFCLTLVLSVYYVVVPYNGAIKELGDKDVIVNVTIEDGEEIYFESLEQSKIDGYNDLIKEYESIVASSDYSNKEKEEALKDIDEVVAKIKLEDEIEKSINQAGYSNTYIMIKDSVVHVIVKVNEPTPDKIRLKLGVLPVRVLYVPSPSLVQLPVRQQFIVDLKYALSPK